MEETRDTGHIVGIVPLAGFNTDLEDFPCHPALSIIGQNYVAIERSIVECAFVGCKTIWVIVDDDWHPVIRDRAGEFIPDPHSLIKGSFTRFPSEHYKHIPIFYAPINPKDRDKRDSFAWGILHGCLMSFIASSKISKWAKPVRYYISSPYAVYDPEIPGLKTEIKKNPIVMLSNNGRNVINCNHMGFAFDPETYKDVVYQAKKNKNVFESFREISIPEMFSCLLKKEVAFYEIESYNSISSWELYKNYLQSDDFSMMSRHRLLQWRDKNGN